MRSYSTDHYFQWVIWKQYFPGHQPGSWRYINRRDVTVRIFQISARGTLPRCRRSTVDKSEEVSAENQMLDIAGLFGNVSMFDQVKQLNHSGKHRRSARPNVQHAGYLVRSVTFREGYQREVGRGIFLFVLEKRPQFSLGTFQIQPASSRTRSRSSRLWFASTQRE